MQNEVTALDLVMNFFLFCGWMLDINCVVAAEEIRGICSLMHVPVLKFGAGALQSQGQGCLGTSDLERAAPILPDTVMRFLAERSSPARGVD